MKTRSIEEFVLEAASKSPTPGGGSVVALISSLSASLGAMSANLTIDKKGYELVNDKMKEIASLLEKKAQEYLEYISLDINAYEEVVKGYRLKKETIEEKEYRNKYIQEKTYEALLVPYKLVIDLSLLIEPIMVCFYEGNKNVQSDALIAMIMLRSAILSCICNVMVNMNLLKDDTKKGEIKEKLEKIKNEVIVIEKELINNSVYFRI